jgi:hypothetical protein
MRGLGIERGAEVTHAGSVRGIPPSKGAKDGAPGKIKINVKGSGQECPLHTTKTTR